MARELDPSNYSNYPHLARCYLALGQVEQAWQCARDLRRLGEADWALEVEGQILLSQRRYDEAVARIRPLRERGDDVFSEMTPVCAANALADAGRLEEAGSVLAAAAAEDARRSQRARRAERQVSIAYLSFLRQDKPGVRSSLVPFLADLNDPVSLSLAGALLARTGDFISAARVLSLLDQWPGVPIASRARARLRAEIALARHSPGAGALVNAADRNGDSLIGLDFSLRAALALHRDAEIDRARRRITGARSVLIKWNERPALPGLYWSALCQVPGGTTGSGLAQTCHQN